MSVQAEIITIGDEILIGQTVDTNSAWMGSKLNEYGVDVDRIVSVRDTKEAILETLDSIKGTTQIVLLTGGLGPTKDDLTKHVLLEYFGGELVLNQEALDNIYRIFKTINLEVSEVNRDQALLPSTCKVLINKMGTASGMLFKKGEAYVISMPGVPYEMKSIMENSVFPIIEKELVTGHIVHKTVLTFGVPESLLAAKIETWEDNLPNPLKLAYLPSPGLVKLRITGKGDNKDKIRALISQQMDLLRPIIGEHIFGNDNDSIEKLIGSLLKERNATIATAESCTGGNIAHRITTVSGSSSYFFGSVVAYDNSVKEKVLGVSSKTLQSFGAVSKETVLEMATNVKRVLGTDYSIATSGIAGPNGGTEEKPVGTVWIAISGPFGTQAKQFMFGKNRERNIKKSTFIALNLLRIYLLKNSN